LVPGGTSSHIVITNDHEKKANLLSIGKGEENGQVQSVSNTYMTDARTQSKT
jgi:hypothetical protein